MYWVSFGHVLGLLWPLCGAFVCLHQIGAWEEQGGRTSLTCLKNESSFLSVSPVFYKKSGEKKKRLESRLLGSHAHRCRAAQIVS
jgi:hypothetical protein